jgi:hypothetical protein
MSKALIAGMTVVALGCGAADSSRSPQATHDPKQEAMTSDADRYLVQLAAPDEQVRARGDRAEPERARSDESHAVNKRRREPRIWVRATCGERSRSTSSTTNTSAIISAWATGCSRQPNIRATGQQ